MNPDRDQATPATQLTLPLPYPGVRPGVGLRTTEAEPTRGKARAVLSGHSAGGPVVEDSLRRSGPSRAASRAAAPAGRRRARPWRLDERTCEIGRRGVEAARALLGDPGSGESRDGAGQVGPSMSGGKGAGRAA